jgi:hypothetical protein
MALGWRIFSVGKSMNNTPPATQGKSVAAKLIGLMTLLWGGAYTAVGARFLLVWADLWPIQNNDWSDRIIIERSVAHLALLGVIFLVFGIIALAAVLGLFSRKPWGRVLTLLVAVLAISLGLCFHAVVPGTGYFRDATDDSLAVAQVLFGILALSILSLNRVEPIGIYVLRPLSILVGLPVVLFWGFLLPDSVSDFFHRGGRDDTADRFGALVVLSGFVAGLLIVATGVGLLTLRSNRFRTVVALMIAAGSAEAAMAAFAFLGALLGHTREGLLEGYLLLFVPPLAAVLLLLTASGVWYLRRPDVRRALEAEREPRQGSAEQVAATFQPRE